MAMFSILAAAFGIILSVLFLLQSSQTLPVLDEPILTCNCTMNDRWDQLVQILQGVLNDYGGVGGVTAVLPCDADTACRIERETQTPNSTTRGYCFDRSSGFPYDPHPAAFDSNKGCVAISDTAASLGYVNRINQRVNLTSFKGDVFVDVAMICQHDHCNQ